jgi:hypothetical protein
LPLATPILCPAQNAISHSLVTQKTKKVKRRVR